MPAGEPLSGVRGHRSKVEVHLNGSFGLDDHGRLGG
jgi:hypothetical protein